MTKNTDKLTQFRQKVYQSFGCRADSKMELLDALCSQDSARSVAELSLTPAFRRHYSALYHAVADLKLNDQTLRELAIANWPQAQHFPFWLLGVDVTPAPRPFARTLSDCQTVYQTTPIAGQKPITYGHQYSTVALLPPKAETQAPWVVPLGVQRIHSPADKEMVGSQQVKAILEDEQLPLHNQLCVEVVDSAYSKPAYLCANRHHDNLVTITRVRSNRVFYRQPPDGSRCWYGESFSLRDVSTWWPPDETGTTSFTSQRGRTYQVQLKAWRHMLMRGKRKPYLPMQRYPFTLIQVTVRDRQGNMLFRRPLWLIVMGSRRAEICLFDAYEAYLCRSQLEHFFRFGKQRLLLDKYQTPVTVREEQWWRLVHLAYLQLWVARPLATILPRPWEKYLLQNKAKVITARVVQRDFGRLIRQLGTPARVPKPRNRSSGRRLGQCPRRRLRFPRLRKG